MSSLDINMLGNTQTDIIFNDPNEFMRPEHVAMLTIKSGNLGWNTGLTKEQLRQLRDAIIEVCNNKGVY